MKSISLRDVFLTTVLLLSALYLISLIPFNSDALNPIQKTLGDFELTDVVFSQLRDNPPVDERVVIVNIGKLNRAEIARQIEIINQYKPRVIAIDARFTKPKEPEVDSAFASACSKVDHMILGSELFANHEKGWNDSLMLPNPLFTKYAESAYVNIITKGKDVFKMTRDIVPKDHYYKWYPLDTVFTRKKLNDSVDIMIRSRKYLTVDTIAYAFPTRIAWYYDSNAVKRYLDRGKETETINFRGNIDLRLTDVSSNSKGVYPILDVDQVLDTLFMPDVVKDKIVIMGYLGADISENSWEDKFFTPLNKNYIGKTYPDMYGVVAHANAVSMILDGDFINEMPEGLNDAISIIIVFINVFFITYLFFKLKVWYEAFSNIVVLLEAAALVWLVLYIFNHYDFKFDVTLPIVALFLTGNIVEIYYGMIKPGLEKLGTKFVLLRKITRQPVKA